MKVIERKLNFGARSLEDIFDATLGADISYWYLPDRKTCTVCGRGIKRGPSPQGRTRGYGRVTVSLCSPGCRQAYREWLRD